MLQVKQARFVTRFEKAMYQRRWNSRSRSKNLRCFPDHSVCAGSKEVKHQHTKFCGQSVELVAHVEGLSDDPSAPGLFATAFFGVYCDEAELFGSAAMQDFSKQFLLDAERTSSVPTKQFIHCDIEVIGPNQVRIIVNSKLLGWHYQWLSNKHSRNVMHSLNIMLFQDDHSDRLTLLHVCSSPPFLVYTKKRPELNPAKMPQHHATARHQQGSQAWAPQLQRPIKQEQTDDVDAYPQALDPILGDYDHAQTGDGKHTPAQSPTVSLKRKADLDAIGVSVHSNGACEDERAAHLRPRLSSVKRRGILTKILALLEKERVNANRIRENRKFMTRSETTASISAPLFFDALRDPDIVDLLFEFDSSKFRWEDEEEKEAYPHDHESQSPPSQQQQQQQQQQRQPQEMQHPQQENLELLPPTDGLEAAVSAEARLAQSNRAIENHIIEQVTKELACNHDLSRQVDRFFEKCTTGELGERLTTPGRSLRGDPLLRRLTRNLFAKFEDLVQHSVQQTLEEKGVELRDADLFDEASPYQDEDFVLFQFLQSIRCAKFMNRLVERWDQLPRDPKYAMIDATWIVDAESRYEDEFYTQLMCKTGVMDKCLALVLSSMFRYFAVRIEGNMLSVRTSTQLNLQSVFNLVADEEVHDLAFEGSLIWFGQLPKKQYCARIWFNEQGDFHVTAAFYVHARALASFWNPAESDQALPTVHVGYTEECVVLRDDPNHLTLHRRMHEFASKPSLAIDDARAWKLQDPSSFVGETSVRYRRVDAVDNPDALLEQGILAATAPPASTSSSSLSSSSSSSSPP